MAKSIDVSDLDIYYGDFLAVQGVNMTIRAKAVTAFIGPSGCGKSTFLRSLNRMHEVIPGARVDGKIVVDGQDLYDPAVDPVAVRRQIGMVFQRPNPFPTMSVYDNVLAGNRLNAKRIKKPEATPPAIDPRSAQRPMKPRAVLVAVGRSASWTTTSTGPVRSFTGSSSSMCRGSENRPRTLTACAMGQLYQLRPARHMRESPTGMR